jgi:GNAT superfamily N-acetyltransferase
MSVCAPALLDVFDREAAIETVTLAFETDPAWIWMFETADDSALRIREVMARIVDGGLANNSVWRTDNCDSVAVWVPPGARELTPELEDELAGVLAAAGGETSRRALGLFDVFDKARSRASTHQYLSVFATRPEKQGGGLGGALLRAAFGEFDRQSLPCYLESSNPTKNNALYEHLGFEIRETLDTPPRCPLVQSMWRTAR